MGRTERQAVQELFQHQRQPLYELQLKDKLPDMPEEERFALLATNGMLVKRPIVLAGDTVLVGFKPAEWEEALLK